MKAAIINKRGGPEVFRIDTTSKPELISPSSVRVSVEAVSVNPIDATLRSGAMKLPMKFPKILGRDAYGTVLDVGSSVTRFQKGDKVFGMQDPMKGPGTYAEIALFDENELSIAPTNLSSTEAASLPLVSLSAWQSLVDMGQISKGSRVLILGGSGGVGSIAIQLAKTIGATVVTSCSEKNIEFCKHLGADIVIDYQKEAIKEHPEAHDFDLILDAAGGYYRESLPLLKKNGQFLSLTFLGDTQDFTMGNLFQHLRRLLFSRIKSWFGAPRARFVNTKPSGEFLEEIRRLVETEKIRPILAKVLPLEDVAKAHEMIETKRTKGKIVLRLSSDR